MTDTPTDPTPTDAPPAEEKRASGKGGLLLKLLAVFVVLIVTLVAVGFVLPSSYHIERSIEIDAQAMDIHPQVNDLKNWPKWTAWSKEHDPDKYGDLEYTYSDQTIGKGAFQTWNDSHAGEGRLEIVDDDDQNGIRFTLEFDGTPSRGSIRYTKEGEQTRVTWRLRGTTGNNPINRWMHVLFVNKMIAEDYETGLEKLKSLAEKAAEERKKKWALADRGISEDDDTPDEAGNGFGPPGGSRRDQGTRKRRKRPPLEGDGKKPNEKTKSKP